MSNKQHPSLLPKLNLFDATLLIIGAVVGSGIFLTSGIIAQSLPSPGWILFVWFLGMILTLFGGITLAELGTMFPEAGGQYVYLKEAYGPFAGFMFGWIWILAVQTGGIAALSVGFAEYLSYFFPTLSLQHFIIEFQFINISFGQVIAIISIILLTTVNLFGIKSGSSIQIFFTVIKILAIGVLIVAGLYFSADSNQVASVSEQISMPTGAGLWAAVGVSLIAILWTFDGWYAVNIVASEIKNVKRNLPISIILGITLIGFIYLLVNWFYVQALPMSEMAGTLRIGEKAVSYLFGNQMGTAMSALILISIFGCLSATIIYGPRIFYAMSKDKLFFKSLGYVHPKYHTPTKAIIWQGVWASVLCLTGTYEQLYTYVVFAMLLFYVALAIAIFVLRKKRPETKRPYKVWGYPVVPVFFGLAMLWIMINTLIEKPVESMIGLFLIVTGLPVYYYWKRKARST